MSPSATSARTVDRASYGMRSAVILSVTLHVAALGAAYGFSRGFEKKEPLIPPQVVRLGGPPAMKMSGQKRKAPVAGSQRKKAQQRAPEKKVSKPAPKKPKPKPDKKVIGLNPDKKKRTPDPKPKDPTPSTADRAAKETPPEPEPPEKSSAKAIGGFGEKGKGVSLEVGDGSEDVNIDDLEFISYARTVLAEINNRWAGSAFESGAAKVRFVIQKDGSITGVTVVESSGKSYLDGPAKRAVMGADLPPLPQGYRGDILTIKLTFQYGSDR